MTQTSQARGVWAGDFYHKDSETGLPHVHIVYGRPVGDTPKKHIGDIFQTDDGYQARLYSPPDHGPTDLGVFPTDADAVKYVRRLYGIPIIDD